MQNQSTQNSGEIEKKYKFKEMKVYNSVEWLYDNKKKYRQVFDRYETSYVYTELTIHNKYFDIDNWTLKVTLQCFEGHGSNKLICTLPLEKKVSKYDQLIYIREGWGSKKEGTFWKKGSYFWQAFIDGEAVGSKYFYIQESQFENFSVDNYIFVEGMRFFEGHYEEMNIDNRIFLTTFDVESTKYIFTEIALQNKLNADWQCELFIKYYNESGDLKTNNINLQTIKAGIKNFSVIAAYGNNTPNGWAKGKYRAEVVFLETIIAVSYFEVGNEITIGLPRVLLPNKNKVIEGEDTEIHRTSNFEELIAQFDDLIGLEHVKNQVLNHAMYINFLKLRTEKGFKDQHNFEIHSVYTGNPGTGKTTVAMLMGKLYHSMGLLSEGHVHQVDRSDLVGEFIGQTAPKVKEAFKKAKGGILFIDEAYALARSADDSKDFGKEVVELLVKEMSQPNNDMAVIVAGYPKEMDIFVKSNPGLKSRFKTYIDFKDYLPQDLIRIAAVACKQKEVRLDVKAQKRVEELIIRAYRDKDKNFGNARYVYDLIEKAKVNLGLRIMSSPTAYKVDKNKLSLVKLEDIKNLEGSLKPDLPNIPIDTELLSMAIAELNSLSGMEEVKKQINETIQIVKYYKANGEDVLKRFQLHTIFLGNPGTGKTTVARILSKIYKALGVLEKGHIVETDRQGLVAGYVGQTAIKTSEKIDEAMGGVLFIDEAYSLYTLGSHQGDFGNEAIQVILKRMEDHRGQFFVFVAGYPDNMQTFLKANPGLNSRFDKVLQFDDYNADQLFEIAMKNISTARLKPSAKAKDEVMKLCIQMFSQRDKYFGNARTITKLIDAVIKEQNLRIANGGDFKPNAKLSIELEDVINAKTIEGAFSYIAPKIGFKN